MPQGTALFYLIGEISGIGTKYGGPDWFTTRLEGRYTAEALSVHCIKRIGFRRTTAFRR